MKARVSIIAALGTHRELGKGGELIWRITEDLQWVKKLTMGHPLIMGRKTYESIGRPLPGRTTIVVTRGGAPIPGCHICTTLEDALTYARSIEKEEIFIFGGAQIYEAALPYTDRLYLTQIDATDPDADVFFPDYSEFSKILSEEPARNAEIPYRRFTLEREK